MCKLLLKQIGFSLKNLFFKFGFLKLKHPDKLHLGCGMRMLEGWTNIDLCSGDMRLDVLKGLPFKDDSVNFIYHAHFVEHFDVEENFGLFKECRRILKKGGVLRILFPDFKKHCQIYLNNDLETLYKYKEQGTIVFEPEKLKFSPLTEWFNRGFYDFGHKFFYDFKTIEAIAVSAGFTDIYEVVYGNSTFKDLVSIDYYPNTDKLFSTVEIIK